jgi:type IV secretory pathway VirB10-like protein
MTGFDSGEKPFGERRGIRRSSRAVAFLVLAWLGCVGTAVAGDEQIYQWTDEKGVQHFSNTPPETPVEDLERMPEIPYDPEADQARMKEDATWLRKEQQRAERERRRMAEEKAAAEAEKKRRAAEQEKAQDEARQQAEKEAEEKREQHRSTADKSVFVNPSDKIPGINRPPKPTPLPSGSD